MRLVVVGNLANLSYFLVKLLRKHKINAELLMRQNPSIAEDPMSFDKELERYPEWIKFWDNKKNWKLQIIKLMRQYDLVHASTELPIFANFTGRPFIAQATGADIARLASEKSLKGLLLQYAYKRAKIVIFPAPHYYKYVKKLKLKKAIFLPLLCDYEQFRPNKKSKTGNKFVIFHPTNQVWYYKKNFVFLNAFKKLAKINNNIHLIMINRGQDIDKAKKLLNESYLESKVTILPETLAQSELIEYYNNADVIVDQFGVGSSGLIGQEAMSCEKPLVQYLDKELYEKFYPEVPPILNAQTKDEICLAIQKIIKNPDLGIEIGKRSREWILNYHNHEKIIKKYIYLYGAINSKIKFV